MLQSTPNINKNYKSQLLSNIPIDMDAQEKKVFLA